MLHVVCCLLHIFQWSSAALLSVGSCLHALSLLHVARSPLRVVRFSCGLPKCPMSHGVRCLSPGPTSHLICCMLCVASRLLHVAYRPLRVACCLLSRLACCMSHAACCLLQSGAAPAHTQRIAAALAIERLGGRRGPLQCRPRCARVHACVHACGTVSLRVPVHAQGVLAPGQSNKRETAAACLRS